jgi:tungstate transport system permease protein
VSDISSAFGAALHLVATGDQNLAEIVALSLKVSLTAVALAALMGLPLGALLAVHQFRGRTAIIVSANALMGLPPVVVGLLVYMLVSNSGPLGVLQLLYTPAAMIIAQTVLITPIILSLSRQVLEDLHREYDEHLRMLGLGARQRALTLIYEGRASLMTALLAGFGRAIAEVGAVMIVGGNINHVTRTMTTAIALETSKGDLALAVGLGIVLVTLALAINVLAYSVRSKAQWA